MAKDLNGDNKVDEEDYRMFLAGQPGPGGQPPPPPPGEEPPLGPPPECDPEHPDYDPDDPVCEQIGPPFPPEGRPPSLPPECDPDDPVCEQIGPPVSPGPGGPPEEDELFELLEGFRGELKEDPRRKIRVRDLGNQVDEPDLEFLRQLAGFDGLLSLDEIERVLEGGPGGPGGEPPRIGLFEGELEGIDLEERLLFISGKVFEPADEIVLEDNQGRPLDLPTLIEVAGSFPKVFVELN